jgi:hypothetical protein
MLDTAGFALQAAIMQRQAKALGNGGSHCAITFVDLFVDPTVKADMRYGQITRRVAGK